MKKRLMASFLISVFLVVLSFHSVSFAGFLKGLPSITFDSTGVTTYNASTDELSSESLPLIVFSSFGFNFVSDPRSLTINIKVDAGGVASGASGNDLILSGEIDLDGDSTPDVTGTLLIAELATDLTEFFKSTESGTTDQFDFKFRVTGGELVDVFNEFAINSILVVNLTSENSGFEGSFESNFIGDAKGSLGPDVNGGESNGCVLDVAKTCCIPPPPLPGVDDCEGKVVRAVFEYTGDDCSATTNDQEGKAKCSGDPMDVDPVSVVYTGKDPDKITVTPAIGIGVGDEFTVAVNTALRNNLHANTKLEISGIKPPSIQSELLQSLEIHTSCSKAISVGDRFGSLKLIELESTLGGVVMLPDPNAQPTEPTTTCVPPNFPEGTSCDSRPVEVVFEYFGAGCDPLANPQGGKAICAGDAEGATNVNITYVGKDPGKITVSPASGINDGAEVRVTATGRDNLHANTKLQISDTIGPVQSLEIHTSCSQPLRLGDVFGSLRVTEFTTKSGTKAIRGPDDQLVFAETCEVPSAPATPHCTSKVKDLRLEYVGGGCSDGNNPQGGKATCTEIGTLGEPVSITAFTGGRDPVSLVVDPPSNIEVGDQFSISKIIGELKAQTFIDVTDGTNSQSLEIHTSCSKPLNLGDQFGAFKVVAIDRKDDGVVSFGGQVEYQYKVTNLNSDPVIVDVIDDKSGTIATDLEIAGGEMTTLFSTATLFGTTTNIVTVTGTLNGTECVPDSDDVTVEVVDPPPGPFTCDKPINELTMIWNGTETIDVEAFKGSVGSTSLGKEFDVAPGTEVTFTGFAGSPNDVFWVISNGVNGVSKFHLSCSDSDMNGPEDCGKQQGNGKSNDDSTLINTWNLEGIVDASGELVCTPTP